VDQRDRAIGRIEVGRSVFVETIDDKEASELRDKARSFLDEEGTALSDRDVRRMISLLFLGRA
jgi:hypothetical protein